MGNALSTNKNPIGKGNSQNIGINLAGVPYYMPKHLSKVGEKEDYSEYYNYNGYNMDVYGLGVTLLNALFLD